MTHPSEVYGKCRDKIVAEIQKEPAFLPSRGSEAGKRGVITGTEKYKCGKCSKHRTLWVQKRDH